MNEAEYLRRYGRALNEPNLVQCFENHEGGRMSKALIDDTLGLDTPHAKELLAGMVERGVLVDEGDALVLKRA